MTNTDERLIEALRSAGHDDVADALRDRGLATELRDSGHEELAERLEAPTPEAARQNTAATAEPDAVHPGVEHGHQLAAVIGRKADRTRALGEQLLGVQPNRKDTR